MLGITIGFVVLAGIPAGIAHWLIYRDIDAVIDRAQVAADRDDMLQYLLKLKTNMESRGMTRGHTALIFKTDINDMGEHYKVVTRIIERLEGMKTLGKSSTAYQVALDDIRGTIRELPNPADGWAWVSFWWWIVLVTLILAVITCFFEVYHPY